MRVLIAAPVHQSPHIFQEFLKSLNRLNIPPDWKVDKYFVFHNCPDLAQLIDDGSMYSLYEAPTTYCVDETTHRWDNQAVNHVTLMKNAIITAFLGWDYDYLFFVDSDLILHPDTLLQLHKAQKDIIAEVFWTKWAPEGQPLPNAWDFDSYDFAHPKRLEEWRTPGVYHVGMTGACTLIKRRVLEAGVNFSRVFNISFWGEDRHFCIRAASHDFGIWLDTHYPCIHLYRESEYQDYIAAIERGDPLWSS